MLEYIAPKIERAPAARSRAARARDVAIGDGPMSTEEAVTVYTQLVTGEDAGGRLRAQWREAAAQTQAQRAALAAPAQANAADELCVSATH